MPKRDITKRTRFFIWDGVLGIPLLVVGIYPRKSTALAIVGIIMVLTVLDRMGMKVTMLPRRARTFLIGRTRYIRPWWIK